MPAPRYETITEAALRLGVNRRTLQRRIAAGTLTAYTRDTSNKIWLRTSDVDDLGKLTPRHAAEPGATGVSSPSANTG